MSASSENEAMRTLAENLWNGFLADKVAEKLSGAMITKRATVATAANGSTMGVTFPYDTAAVNLPYVSLMADAAVGSQVTVAYIYGSASNGVVIQNGSFTK